MSVHTLTGRGGDSHGPQEHDDGTQEIRIVGLGVKGHHNSLDTDDPDHLAAFYTALSGGEKAIALHLPLFAAVAAHYQAVPEAPRVILLDEVFVGVDAVNRGQVFALLSALELDLMLTSDHEWCTYAELSGIGIHQLITGHDGDEAVTTARFTWNGDRLLPDE